MKSKLRSRNCSGLKETQEIWQLNQIEDSEWDPGPKTEVSFCYKGQN